MKQLENIDRAVRKYIADVQAIDKGINNLKEVYNGDILTIYKAKYTDKYKDAEQEFINSLDKEYNRIINDLDKVMFEDIPASFKEDMEYIKDIHLSTFEKNGYIVKYQNNYRCLKKLSSIIETKGLKPINIIDIDAIINKLIFVVNKYKDITKNNILDVGIAERIADVQGLDALIDDFINKRFIV